MSAIWLVAAALLILAVVQTILNLSERHGGRRR